MSKPSTFPASEIERLAEQFPGRAGFYVKDLTTGETCGHRADERFATASVFKVSVLVTLYQLAEAGHLSLNDRHRVPADVSTHGTGILKSFHDEPELSLRDHCRAMIGVSDNMATDTIIHVIGTDAINRMLDNQGLKNTRVPMAIGRWHYLLVDMENEPINRANDERQVARARRGEYREDGLCYSDSLENLVASPRDMGILLERLHGGELAGPASTAQMIEMLKSNSGEITSALNPEVAKDVASKKGASGPIRADVGIVYLTCGPLVISAFTLTSGNDKRSGSLIQQVTRLVVATRQSGALCPSTS